MTFCKLVSQSSNVWIHYLTFTQTPGNRTHNLLLWGCYILYTHVKIHTYISYIHYSTLGMCVCGGGGAVFAPWTLSSEPGHPYEHLVLVTPSSRRKSKRAVIRSNLPLAPEFKRSRYYSTIPIQQETGNPVQKQPSPLLQSWHAAPWHADKSRHDLALSSWRLKEAGNWT